jgi:hypothetical protein
MYAGINLKDLGELQSRYVLHLFQIAMSYRSLAEGETRHSEVKTATPLAVKRRPSSP